MKIGLSSFFIIVILAISEFAALTPLCVAADTVKMEQGKHAALKSFAEKRLRETKVPGAGVGIIKDGKVRTYDLGGDNTSLEVAEEIAKKFGQL